MFLTSTTLARAPTSPALHYVLNDLCCVQMMNNRLKGGYHLGSTRGREIKTSTKGIIFLFLILLFLGERRDRRGIPCGLYSRAYSPRAPCLPHSQTSELVMFVWSNSVRS